MPRHFLSLLDLSSDELRSIITRAIELKTMLHNGESYTPFQNKTLAMLFDKSSTRTRVSFEAGMAQFGGHALFLSSKDTQLGRGEPVEDAARVLSRMVDIIMIRTYAHEIIERFASVAAVPVINGLTDLVHPCQLLADLQTWFERRGNIQGATVTWIGDGNNMCHSYINAARLLDFNLRIASPKGYEPDHDIVTAAGNKVYFTNDAMDAAKGSDLIVTDVWASMGQEKEQKQREKAFASFQVNTELMQQADKNALFMHCLPAHREEEVTTSVLEGPQSVVWDEAENRLHGQKALIEFLLLSQEQTKVGH